MSDVAYGNYSEAYKSMDSNLAAIKDRLRGPEVIGETPLAGYPCTNTYLSVFGGAKAVTKCGNITIRIKETAGNYDANYKILVGPTALKCVDEILAETVLTKSPAVADRRSYKDGCVFIDVQAKNKTPDQAAVVECQITVG